MEKYHLEIILFIDGENTFFLLSVDGNGLFLGNTQTVFSTGESDKERLGPITQAATASHVSPLFPRLL